MLMLMLMLTDATTGLQDADDISNGADDDDNNWSGSHIVTTLKIDSRNNCEGNYI